MNAPVSSLCRRFAAVAALLLATPFVPHAADRPDTNSIVSLPSDLRIARGMHRDDVVLRLGRPDEAISSGIWMYWDFRAKSRPPGERLDTLLVFFAKDRVSWLRLTERNAAIALLHRIRLQQAADVVRPSNDAEPLKPKIASQ